MHVRVCMCVYTHTHLALLRLNFRSTKGVKSQQNLIEIMGKALSVLLSLSNNADFLKVAGRVFYFRCFISPRFRKQDGFKWRIPCCFFFFHLLSFEICV